MLRHLDCMVKRMRGGVVLVPVSNILLQALFSEAKPYLSAWLLVPIVFAYSVFFLASLFWFARALLWLVAPSFRRAAKRDSEEDEARDYFD